MSWNVFDFYFLYLHVLKLSLIILRFLAMPLSQNPILLASGFDYRMLIKYIVSTCSHKGAPVFICVPSVSEMKGHWVISRLMYDVFSYWVRKLNVWSLIEVLFNKISSFVSFYILEF